MKLAVIVTEVHFLRRKVYALAYGTQILCYEKILEANYRHWRCHCRAFQRWSIAWNRVLIIALLKGAKHHRTFSCRIASASRRFKTGFTDGYDDCKYSIAAIPRESGRCCSIVFRWKICHPNEYADFEWKSFQAMFWKNWEAVMTFRCILLHDNQNPSRDSKMQEAEK